MPTYVRVRGLARRGIRLRSSIGAAGGNAITIAGLQTTIVDLDDPKTRADIAHHSAIGQLQVVDYVSGARVGATTSNNGLIVTSGLVVGNPGQTFVLPFTAGSLTWFNTTGSVWTVVPVAAGTVTIGAPSSTPRIDTVVVNTAGTVSVTAGTPAGNSPSPAPAVATATIPVSPAPVAQVYVPTTGGTAPTYVLDVRPLP